MMVSVVVHLDSLLLANLSVFPESWIGTWAIRCRQEQRPAPPPSIAVKVLSEQ